MTGKAKDLEALYSQLGKQIMLAIETESRKRWLIDQIDRLTMTKKVKRV